MVLKVIEVHCQWCLQCHPSLTAQTDPDILDTIGGTEALRGNMHEDKPPHL